jgi:hypothetical protein
MERFIHRENIAHYKRLLAEPHVLKDQVRHNELLRLLAEEVAKDGSKCRTSQAASSRLISVSNSKRSCAPSSSGSQFVICGKMVR